MTRIRLTEVRIDLFCHYFRHFPIFANFVIFCYNSKGDDDPFVDLEELVANATDNIIKAAFHPYYTGYILVLKRSDLILVNVMSKKRQSFHVSGKSPVLILYLRIKYMNCVSAEARKCGSR